MNRSCTGCAAHCVNWRVSGSIAASSIECSFAHDSFHGCGDFASAAFMAAIDCVPTEDGADQLATPCLPGPGAAAGVLMRPSQSRRSRRSYRWRSSLL
jgi:hypothetical protein